MHKEYNQRVKEIKRALKHKKKNHYLAGNRLRMQMRTSMKYNFYSHNTSRNNLV